MPINKIPQSAFSNDDMIVNTFTATAGQTAFTLTRQVSVNSVLVHINDVIQQPTVDYTVSGSTLTLTAGATVGDDVRVRILSENPLGVSSSGGSGISLAQARAGISVTTVAASGGGSLSYNSTSGVLTFAPSTNSGGGGGSGIALTDLSVASEGTASGNGSLAYNNSNGQFTYTPPTLNGLTNAGDVDFGSNKILYSNHYAQLSDLPSASTYHGMFAHVHGTGKAYYAHAGNWVALADASQLTLDGLTGVSTSGVTSGQVLKYNGTSWAPAADSAGSSGIALGDISVGAEGTASGDGSLAYNNSTGVFTYTPPIIPSVALPDDQEFGVTASGSAAYTFSGAATGNNPTITLQRGKTYRFDVNASGHPFMIRVSNGGSNYTNGVENAGTQSGAVYFTVPDDAPNSLVYQCSVHAAMVGTINIVNNYSAGHVLQSVVYKAATETNLNYASGGAMTAWTAALNDATITPKQADSKIQVTMHIPWVGIANGGATGEIQLQIYRKIGSGGTWTAIGNHQGGAYIANNTYIQSTLYEDDLPNTTNVVYYRPYFRGRYISTGQYSLNRGSNQYYVYNFTEIAQ